MRAVAHPDLGWEEDGRGEEGRWEVGRWWQIGLGWRFVLLAVFCLFRASGWDWLAVVDGWMDGW